MQFRSLTIQKRLKIMAFELQDEARTIADVSCVGLYYYGARYLDAKYSRWLSADPVVGEYIPMAPVNDEAKKHNEELPGQGGVFNIANFRLYHYAGNNPVKYTDPDGKKTRSKDVQRQIDALGTKPNTPITDTVILKFQL